MRFVLSLMLMLATLTIFLACQNSTTTKTSKANNSAINPVDLSAEAPRITLDEAKKDFDSGNAVFVDTRPEFLYRQEHIKGAVNLSANTYETGYKDLPTDRKIIAYCS